ncbi:hypothetical protein TRAPUB_12201, partial [Trametes pubescens]
MNAVRWYASKNGVPRRLPTVRQVKLAREQVLNVAGAEPWTYEGNGGHLYTTNDLPILVKHVSVGAHGKTYRNSHCVQEFANPVTRADLHLYPEVDGNKLCEARHAKRWQDEVDAALAAPMARSTTGKDYFVNEVALANIDMQGTVAPVMVARWFIRAGKLIAKAHPMRLTLDGVELVIDAREQKTIEIPLTSFVLNIDNLLSSHTQAEWRLPAPDKIH